MRIMCAKCGRAVERVETWREPRDTGVQITAFCHGEEDTMRIGLGDMAAIGSAGLAQIEHGEGVAFATPRIAAG